MIWLVFFFGISLELKLVKGNNFTFAIPQKSTINLFNPNTFDSNSSSSSSIFTFDKDVEDELKALIPPSTFKYIRSNTKDFGLHGEHINTPKVSSNHHPQISKDKHVTDQLRGVHANANKSVAAASTSKDKGLKTLFVDNFGENVQHAIIKPHDFLTDVNLKNIQKIPYDSFPALSELTSGISIFDPNTMPHTQSLTSSRRHQVQQNPYGNGHYKTQYPTNYQTIPITSKAYSPMQFQNQQSQQLQNYDRNPYDNIHLTTTPSVDVSGKRVEFPYLQTLSNFPSYSQSFEANPIIYGVETGRQLKSEPGFGITFDFAKPKNIQKNQRPVILSPYHDYAYGPPLQVLPLQTNGAPNFPRFKGASFQQFPNKVLTRIPNDYEEFKSQPQLHFSNKGNNSPIRFKTPGGKKEQKFKKIREDVEIKSKKRPIQNLKEEDENYEDEHDNGEKQSDSYYPRNEEYDSEDENEKHFTDPEFESDFKSSKSNPFKYYDNDFQKPKKNSRGSNEDDEDDDESNINLAAKYRYPISSDDDDEDESESSEDRTPSKYRPHDNFSTHHNYEYEDDVEEPPTKNKYNRPSSSTRYHNTKRSKPKKQITNNFSNYKEPLKKKYTNKSRFPHFDSNSKRPEKPFAQSSYHQDESSSKGSRKNRHRTYRDESGEPSTQRLSSFESGFHASEVLFPSMNSNNTKVSTNNLGDFDASRLSGEDNNQSSTYSSEEAVIGNRASTRHIGHPPKTVPKLSSISSSSTVFGMRSSKKNKRTPTESFLNKRFKRLSLNHLIDTSIAY